MLIQKAKTEGRYEASQTSPESDGILRVSLVGYGDSHYGAIKKCIDKIFGTDKSIYPDSFISEFQQQTNEF